MENALKIQAHYDFTDFDVQNLCELKIITEKYVDDFPAAFFNHVKRFDKAGKYLKDAETIKRHQFALKEWFKKLFCGNYGAAYIDELERIGQKHVDIELDPHYVNAAMHFVKSYSIDIIQREVEDRDKRRHLLQSIEKILNINLDVITSSYIEEEKKKYLISQKFEGFLIGFSERFSYGLNLILVLGLVAMGAMVMGLFVYDLSHIFEGNIEKGLLSTLGSLLMLWVVIELVDTEIEHLKGGKFAISVFIGVALVAVVRKILITFLKAEAVEAQISLIVAVGVLGGVYWLVSQVDKKKK